MHVAAGYGVRRVSGRRDLAARGFAHRLARPGAAGLLCAAAVLHVALAVALYELGRREVSAAIDGSGIVIAVAPDAALFREDAARLSEALRMGEFRYWLGADSPFHAKLYALPFAAFGPWLGYNVLAAEPLNCLLYLALLALIYGLGREVFDRRAGLLAAGAVALWPSLLLYSTQLLKDPIYVPAFTAFMLILVRWLTRSHTWAGALLACAAAAPAIVTLWLTRSDMGGLLVVAALLCTLLLAAQQLRARKAHAPNLAGAGLLLAATLLVPFLLADALELGSFDEEGGASRAGRSIVRGPSVEEAAGAAGWEASRGYVWTRAARHVGEVRRRFTELYPDSGSNIDADVRIEDAGDLLSYLPRAAVVGFFAPFPDMWIGSGQRVGSAGRRLAGLESLAMYAVEALAAVGLWLRRRRLAAWLLSAVAAAGVIALGLVIVNVGALYRLRYAFVALLVVLAAGAVVRALDRHPAGGRGGGRAA